MAYKLANPPPPPPTTARAFTTLSTSPPSSPASSRNSTFGRSSVHTTLSTAPTTAPSSPMKSETFERTKTHVDEEEASERYPTAMIDVERISDVMAARLTICLLGHVLYLKGQIPFPIAQLLKMSLSRRSDPKTAKKHDALLSSFDVLSSHLGSTFTALSTALALGRRCRSKGESWSSGAGENYTPFAVSQGCMAPEEKVHIAFVIGPSVTSTSAARARVVFEICGLQVKVWGECTSLPSRPRLSLEGRAGRVLAELGERRGSDQEEEDSDQEEEDSDHEDEDEVQEEDIESNEESVPESDSSDASFEDDEDEEDFDTEEVLRNAERLLSRTLAVANADSELGMAAELQPSQTHVLLRAPRRFTHPSWVPRQALSRDMDKFLSAFDASQPDPKNNTKKTSQFKVKTECVRLRCNASFDVEEVGDTKVEDEDGQMIWWTWDGKLEGFSDF